MSDEKQDNQSFDRDEVLRFIGTLESAALAEVFFFAEELVIIQTRIAKEIRRRRLLDLEK